MSAGLATYLDLLYSAEPAGGLVEVRHRRTDRGGMGQSFFRWPEERGLAVEAIRRLGRETDCYVGVAPRRRRHGGRSAIARVHVLWVDCDGPESIAALGRFSPAPSMIVRSGSGRHAYWSLWPPVAPAEAEAANRRLALALGADLAAIDGARILRPPGTLNLKTGQGVPVTVERLETEVYTVEEVVGELPDPEPRRREVPASPLRDGDPLLDVSPIGYVAALTGREVGRDGKARCPFHADGGERTPSLHAYEDAEDGWYCFACGEGGTVIDLAAKLWHIEARGAGYHELRRRLAGELLGREAA